MSVENLICPKCRGRIVPDPISTCDGLVTCPACGWEFHVAGCHELPAEPYAAVIDELDQEVGLVVQNNSVELLNEGEVAGKEPVAQRNSRVRKKAGPPIWARLLLVFFIPLGVVGTLLVLNRDRNAPHDSPRDKAKDESSASESELILFTKSVHVPAGHPMASRSTDVIRHPFALESTPTPIPGPRTHVTADIADVVYLLPDDTKVPEFRGSDLFERELVRQSLWLSAREDFGLRVRDSSLGESVLQNLPGDRQFRVRHVISFSTPEPPWSITVGSGNAEHKLWAGRLSFDIDQYIFRPAASLVQAEQLSREFFGKCLVATGFEPVPRRSSTATIPPEVEVALEDLRETVQFAAVRRLQAEVREKGESPNLLAGLSRGYANLGLLTQFHWNSAPMVFKARGLLYAQRFLTRYPDDPAAIRTRAYAAALAGMHQLALDDLAAARKLAATEPKVTVPQPWVEMIDAYVHFDLRRLAAARAASDTPLAPPTPVLGGRGARDPRRDDPRWPGTARQRSRVLPRARLVVSDGWGRPLARGDLGRLYGLHRNSSTPARGSSGPTGGSIQGIRKSES